MASLTTGDVQLTNPKRHHTSWYRPHTPLRLCIYLSSRGSGGEGVDGGRCSLEIVGCATIACGSKHTGSFSNLDCVFALFFSSDPAPVPPFYKIGC